MRSLAFRRQRLSPRLSGRPLAPPLQSSSPNCSPACASAQRSSARVLISANMENVLTTTKFRESGSLGRSEEHTSELQSLMRISYAVFCLKKNKHQHTSPI